MLVVDVVFWRRGCGGGNVVLAVVLLGLERDGESPLITSFFSVVKNPVFFFSISSFSSFFFFFTAVPQTNSKEWRSRLMMIDESIE